MWVGFALITLIEFSATWIAILLSRFKCLEYLELTIIFWVARHMIWESSSAVAIDLNKLKNYNTAVPVGLDITPAGAAERQTRRQNRLSSCRLLRPDALRG